MFPSLIWRPCMLMRWTMCRCDVHCNSFPPFILLLSLMHSLEFSSETPTSSTDAATATGIAAAQKQITKLVPLYPLRSDWTFDGGYCGEQSIQLIAARHGVWISQAVARSLGGGELLLGVNLEGVVDQLGFQSVSWSSTTRATPVNLKKYMVWMKQQILQDRPVIFAAKIKGGEDEEYDHIMPAYGIQYQDLTKTIYDATDRLCWTNVYGNEVTRQLSTPGFYGALSKCRFTDKQGGCISNDAPLYGLAMGGLRDANKLLRPLRITITSWSNSTKPTREPLIRANATGKYQLDAREGVAVGQVFTVFRFDGPGSLPVDPASVDDLLGSDGLTISKTFTMGPDLVLDDSVFGVIKSNSVVYFVSVLGPAATGQSDRNTPGAAGVRWLVQTPATTA